VRTLLIAAVAALVLAAPAAADPTGPQIVWGDPVDGAEYYQGQSVQAAYGCEPGPAGWPVVSCVGDAALGDPVDTSTAGTHTFTVRAEDYAGAVTTETHTYTVFDTVAPTVTFTAPLDHGAYEIGTTVTVSYSCDDPGGSGIQACLGSIANGTRLTLDRLGTFSLDVTAVDWAGNQTRTSAHWQVVDTTPPLVGISVPADGATFAVGQNVTPVFSCSDPGGSGIQLCAGGAVDTSTVGLHTFVVRAYDFGGNITTATRSYTVIYPFSGFFSPLAAEGTFASVHAGDAIPVKFALGGDHGTGVVTAAVSAPADCATGDITRAPTAIGTTVAYAAKQDRYTLQWPTAKAWAGTCRAITLTLDDGSTHVALARLVK
jgi:hypothetical protein